MPLSYSNAARNAPLGSLADPDPALVRSLQTHLRSLDYNGSGPSSFRYQVRILLNLLAAQPTDHEPKG
jgi:hypothetical protein